MYQRALISSAFGIVVTLVIAAGVGGYIHSQSLIVASEYDEATPAPLHGNKQTSSPTSQSTIPAGWKTYRNDEYEFEVRYPSDWTVTDTSSTNSGEQYAGVLIKSRPRLDLTGYENESIYYLIAMSSAMRSNVSTVADFASDKPNQQSPWNTGIGDEVRKSTMEYEIGQEIIKSFKFTK